MVLDFRLLVKLLVRIKVCLGLAAHQEAFGILITQRLFVALVLAEIRYARP